MTHDDYLSHDAVGLAELVREGKTDAISLLEIALERIEALDPKINAVVHLMADDARRAAQRGSDGPFAGVPFLAKDLTTMYAGHPTSSGSRFLAEHVVTWDSELARRVKASGLLVLGKTNTPEWGLLPVTEPELWGPARNPWDTTRSPGGSSGGSGAAIAAGIVPMAGGGDGGGSIRIPASCCGLFGLKPTQARTPSGPKRGQLWRGAAVEHVLTRSVRDSAEMLDATHGPDAGAPIQIPPPARPFVEEVGADPGKLRIAWTTEPTVPTEVHPDCVAAVRDAADLLEALGHDVVEDHVEIDGPTFARAFLTVVAGELGADVDDGAEMVGRRPRRNEMEPSTWALYLLSDALSAKEFAEALRWVEVMGRDVGRFFQEYDLLLTPTVSTPPPPVGSIKPSAWERLQLQVLGTLGSGRLIEAAGLIDEAAKTALDFIPWTPVFNVTGQPAMSVPLFWNDQGLPVGVHLVGRYADEATLLRLAARLEQARPWFHRLPQLARSHP
ncbi:MAG: amidase [Longimicrobiales bacterium]|nr:amidase [Longimicrobiales bacterium]